MGNEVTDAFKHCAMPGEPAQTLEVLRHDGDGKVPAAARGTRVTRVLCTVVVDVEHDGRQRVQTLGQCVARRHCEGSDR